MGSDKFLILAIVAVVLPSLTMATEHKVGGDKGWTTDFNYTKWANERVFLVGDTLVFQYESPTHNVFKVNKSSFQSCTVPPSNEALNTGHDIVALTTAGKKWYICGKARHCADHNQKLVINVLDAEAPAPAPTSSAHTTSNIILITHQMYVAVVIPVVALMAVF